MDLLDGIDSFHIGHCCRNFFIIVDGYYLICIVNLYLDNSVYIYIYICLWISYCLYFVGLEA